MTGDRDWLNTTAEAAAWSAHTTGAFTLGSTRAATTISMTAGHECSR
jgi:hypothetical protein